MAKMIRKICKKCIYYGEKCTHDSNKGIVINCRCEKDIYIKTPEEINKNGQCTNYAQTQNSVRK